MKKIIFISIFSIYIYSLSIAQVTGGNFPCAPDVVFMVGGNGVVTSSSSSTTTTDWQNILDGDYSSDAPIASTNLEPDPWVQIDLQEIYYIENMAIHYPSLGEGNETWENYYILTSLEPFASDDLSTNLNSSSVNYLHIAQSMPSGLNIPLTNLARYVRIQNGNSGGIQSGIWLREVTFTGGPGGGGGDPEICDDGIDNDCDFKTDCEDEDCSAIVQEPVAIMGTCPICCDGKLRIVAYNLNGHPLRVYTIDADGNEIDFMPTNNSTFESPELPDGTYTIYIVNLETDCVITKVGTINSLPEIPEPDVCCENGGLESGTFEGWSGGGVNYPAYQPVGSPNGLELDEHGCIIDMNESNHVILPSGVADPLAPDLDLSTDGNFIVRLGSPNASGDPDINGGSPKSAWLQYCFTVKECNSFFRFNYAMVLRDPVNSPTGSDPTHTPPTFCYEVSTSSEAILSCEETLIEGDITDNENFEAVAADDVAWKGWTCQSIDLSAYIGEEVCIRFETSHCAHTGHAGYAYIDALCQSQEEARPIANVNANSVYCSNQSVDIDGGGSRDFNEYRWTICRYLQGSPSQCFSTSGNQELQFRKSMS